MDVFVFLFRQSILLVSSMSWLNGHELFLLWETFLAPWVMTDSFARGSGLG